MSRLGEGSSLIIKREGMAISRNKPVKITANVLKTIERFFDKDLGLADFFLSDLLEGLSCLSLIVLVVSGLEEVVFFAIFLKKKRCGKYNCLLGLSNQWMLLNK